ncbi:MAG: L28 family ribosomal protein [Patescibacteria group bacterium]
MAYQCEICEKKSHAGRQHTHHAGVAGGQWKKRAPKTGRMFRPNLHWVTMPIDGMVRRVKACAKCIKRIKFDNKLTNLQINKLTGVTS